MNKPEGWMNHPDTYKAEGEKYKERARLCDWCGAKWIYDWVNKAILLELPENRDEARRMFREATKNI